MFNTAMLNNIVRGLDPVHTKTLNLRQGQVFQGTITQLYPGQLAQLQLGQMTLSAQLEAQLEKGGRYWFRVMAGDGVPKLRVLENVPAQPQGAGHTAANAQAVLQQMGLPPTSNHENVLQHLTRMNLPFTKQNIAEGGRLLEQSGLPVRQSLEVLTTIIQRGLPLTNETFQSIASLSANRNISDTMAQLNSSLQQLPAGNFQSGQLQQLLANLLAQTDPSGGHAALKGLLQQMQGGDPAVQREAFMLARQTGIMPSNTSDTVFFEQFKAAVLRPENEAAVRQLWPHLFQGSQAGLELRSMDPRALFSYLMGSVRLEQPQGAALLLQLMNPQASQQTVLSQLGQWLSNSPDSTTRGLWQAVQDTRTDTPLFVSTRSTMESPLRLFLQQLGLQHEHDLRSNQLQQDQAQRNQTLKSQLLQFLQQSQQLPQGVREQAEFLLQRLTGYQLMSSDNQGPVQHTLVQIPVKFAEKYRDLTVQWEGRENPDGSIDETHCRILFYLQLEAIEETAIDVQIQNRVVSLTVFNDNEKPYSVENMWLPVLKKKLEGLDYRLSSIRWKQPSETDSPVSFPGKNMTGYTDDPGYRGVDVRI